MKKTSRVFMGDCSRSRCRNRVKPSLPYRREAPVIFVKGIWFPFQFFFFSKVLKKIGLIFMGDCSRSKCWNGVKLSLPYIREAAVSIVKGISFPWPYFPRLWWRRPGLFMGDFSCSSCGGRWRLPLGPQNTPWTSQTLPPEASQTSELRARQVKDSGCHPTPKRRDIELTWQSYYYLNHYILVFICRPRRRREMNDTAKLLLPEALCLGFHLLRNAERRWVNKIKLFSLPPS